MATCSVNPKVLRALRKKVISELNSKVAAKESFDVNLYMKDLYDFMLNVTNDKALSLDAVRMVPLFVAQVASLERSIRKLEGVDATQLLDMTDNLLDEDLSVTEKLLGLTEGEEVKKKLKHLNKKTPDESKKVKSKKEINSDYKGKIIYVTMGSGKSEFTNNYEGVIDADTVKTEIISNTEWGLKNPKKDSESDAEYIGRFSYDPSNLDSINKINDETLASLKTYSNKGFTVLTGTIKFIPEVDIVIINQDGASSKIENVEKQAQFKNREAILAAKNKNVIYINDFVENILFKEMPIIEEPVVAASDISMPVPKQTIGGIRPVQSISSEQADDTTIEAVPATFRSTNPLETAGNEFSYKVQRNLLTMLTDQGVSDMSEVEDGEFTKGFFISIKKSSEVSSEINEQEDPFVYVITDKQGTTLEFNEDLESVVQDGKPAYFRMQKYSGKNNKGELSQRDRTFVGKLLNNIKSLTGFTTEQAKEIRGPEIKEMQKIMDYVKSNPSTPLILNITGGSQGIIITSSAKAKRTKPSTFKNVTGEVFAIGQVLNSSQILDQELPKNNVVYYTNDQLGGVYIEMKREPFRELNQGGAINSVINLLTEDVYNEKGKLLNGYDRQEHLQKILNVNNINGIKMTINQDKSFAFSINDWSDQNFGVTTLYDNPTQDNKEAAQTNLRNYLEANVKQKNYPVVEVNFNKKAYEKNENIFQVENEDGKLVLKDTGSSYLDYLKNNMSLTAVPNTDSGNIVSKNSFFTLQLSDESSNKVYDIKEVTEEDNNPIDNSPEIKNYAEESIDIIDVKDDELFKTLDVSNRSKQATQKQIDAAQTWYNNSPLSKYIPFKEMFDLVNIKNPDAIATWAISGITLYKGSDYSDLYHEAWHGFTQTFLTKQQKNSLYSEVKKKDGSFLDHNNNRVRFSKASNLQIEEYLAESFRSYMLSGQKSLKGSPKQNSFFKKVWNILKALFTDSTYKEVIENQTADQKINELFDKLRVGDIKEYSFTLENASFNSLNKGPKSFNERTDGVTELNFQDAMDGVNMIDYFISEYITIQNAKLNPEQQREYIAFQKLTPPKGDKKKAQEYIAKKAQFSPERYVGLSLALKNPTPAYKYAKKRLLDLFNEQKEIFNNSNNESEKASAVKKAQTLSWMIKEFGNTENLKRNITATTEDVKGMIAYHMKHTKFYQNQLDEIDFDNVNEDTIAANSQRAGIDRKGNESSHVNDAKPEVLYLFESLVDTNNLNKYGIPEKANWRENFVKVIRATENTQTYEEWASKFMLLGGDPQIQQIISKIGNPTDQGNAAQINMWSNVWQTFNKTRIGFVQATTNTYTSDDLGFVVETNVGEALTEEGKVSRTWDSLFQSGNLADQTYILYDDQGAKLNISKILKKFPTLDSANINKFEFIRAIGMSISDLPGIKKELKKGDYRIDLYYKYITDQKNKKYPIRKPSDITFDLKKIYKKLLKLEGEYSNVFTNFARLNAENNVQYEHSLNNFLTTVTNAVNNSNSYSELIALPYMQRFDVENNPFIKNSVWFNSIFDMNNGGVKRPNASLELYNIAGSKVNEEGVASAKADEATKFNLDMNLVIQGYPELPRHSDKSTSYGIRVNGTLFGGKTASDTYISLDDITQGDTEMYNRLTERLLPILSAELSRVREFNNTNKYNDSIEYDYSYLTDGKNLQIFDDILSKDLINKLEDLAKSKDGFESALQNNTDNIIDIFQDEIKDYFTYLIYKDGVVPFSRMGVISDNLSKTITKKLTANKQATSRTSIENVAIKSYVLNSFLNNIESTMFLYGDPAQYNHAKEGLHKRNAGTGSTGTIYRTDQIITDLINKLNGVNSYSKELGVDNKFTGAFNTAIVEDNNVQSIYYNSLVKSLGSEEKASDYLKQNEADAQGLITIDAYRELKIAQGSWKNEHQLIYLKAIKGDSIAAEDIESFFPVIKGQYWGPVNTDNLIPVNAFHKYSLFPLIPSAIKNTNADIVHKRMVRENISYLTFESGSKIGNVTKSQGFDKLYTDRENKILVNEIKSTDVTTPYFTKNTIRLEYLKDQLYISDTDKNKVIFSTQLRKLVEDGLFINGVPKEFEKSLIKKDPAKRMQKWKTTKDKSKYLSYTLATEYEELINKLTKLNKEKLFKQIGYSGKGELNPDSRNALVRLAKSELERKDVGLHRIDSLNNTAADLSVTLDAETIDKIVNSLIEKRLVQQKVTGESLVQVATTLFEKSNSSTDINFSNPTKEDLEKYNKKNLAFYVPTSEGTKAMKVKIALRRDFKNLLDFKDLDGNKIDSIERLNELIKNEDWLNKDNNRAAITMVGVRIPVQGMNSMEVMEVGEFLEEAAGNIIIPPTEIVTKSGADFDVDKMTVMMPSIGKNINKVKITNKFLRDQQKQNPELDFSRDNIDILFDAVKNQNDVYSLTEEDQQILDVIESYTGVEGEYVTGDNIAGVQNALINKMQEIISLPQNYESLVTPNSTNLFTEKQEGLKKSLVEEASQYNITGYNVNSSFREKERVRESSGKKMMSPTKIFEPGYNLAKHQYNKVGKQVLGLGAVDNTYNTLLNRIGLVMTPQNINESVLQDLILQVDTLSNKKNRTPSDINDLKELRRQLNKFRNHKLLLNHNKVGQGISLSSEFSAGTNTKISDIINQLMNGWVDVAADAWVFDIQGNKELAPAMLFMIQAGVPIRETVLFLSNPLVQEYAIASRKYASPSTLADVNMKDSFSRTQFRSTAAVDVMSNLGLGVTPYTKMGKANAVREEFMKDYNKSFTIDSMKKNLDAFAKDKNNYVANNDDIAGFLHFLQIQEMSNNVRDIKMSTNVDTSKDGTSVEARTRIAKLKNLAENVFEQDVVKEFKDNTPIGAFFNSELQINLLEGLLPFRNDRVIYSQIQDVIDNETFKKISPDKNKRIKLLLNDFNNYLFQNELKYFNSKDIKSFRGYKINKSVPKDVRETAGFEYGLFIKEGIMYLNLPALKKQFNSQQFNSPEYTSKYGLAKIQNVDQFQSEEEYIKFVLEREVIRSQTPINKELYNSKKFQYVFNSVQKHVNKKETESDSEYAKKIITNSYEIYLREEALRNIFNTKNLFKANTRKFHYAFADGFMRIKNDFPELNELQIFSEMQLAPMKEGDKSYNLIFKNSDLDGDMINVLNENLKNLTDISYLNNVLPDTVSQTDKADIIKYFEQFPIVAFLQSGWESSGAYSINKIVDQDKIQAILAEPVSKLKKTFNNIKNDNINSDEASKMFDEYFKPFLTKFSMIRQSLNYGNAIRGVDYFQNFSILNPGSITESNINFDEASDYIMDPKLKNDPLLNIPTTLPNYNIDRSLVNKDGSKVLAVTRNGKMIILNPVDSSQEFFSYFSGDVGGATSQQKKEVMKKLDERGYSKERLERILDTAEKANLFLVLHEQSHIDNNDSSVYFLQGEDLLTEDKIDIEVRASLDALRGVEMIDFAFVFEGNNSASIDSSADLDLNTIRRLAVSQSNFYNIQDYEFVKEINNEGSTIIINNGSRTTDDKGSSKPGHQLKNTKNTVQLPTYESYSRSSGQDFGKDAIKDKEGQIDPVIKEEIDNSIELIKQAVGTGVNILWDEGGYGQQMLSKNTLTNSPFAQQTFLYLSKALYENFGYLNPGYLNKTTNTDITGIVSEGITNKQIKEAKESQVLELMKNCGI